LEEVGGIDRTRGASIDFIETLGKPEIGKSDEHPRGYHASHPSSFYREPDPSFVPSLASPRSGSGLPALPEDVQDGMLRRSSATGGHFHYHWSQKI